MTRILVLSDLHLESAPAWSLPEVFPPFDVAVLAGDIDASPERSVRRLAEAPGLAGHPVVYVPGNHELYRGGLDERLAAGRAACVGTRVHQLDRRSVTLSGVRFIGAVLWTDYLLLGGVDKAMTACRRRLNDHRLIEVGPPGSRRLFRPEDAAALHRVDRAFIEAELESLFVGATVVVTHHAPHAGSVAARFAGDPTTAGFASDLGRVIVHGRPTLWVHGHVHDGFDYRVGATRVLANPKGYGPRRRGGRPENAKFDPALVVDLPNERDGYDARAVAILQAELTPLIFSIERWTILRVRSNGDRHVLGYRFENGRRLASPPICAFDHATAIATTSCGNRYSLLGEQSEVGLEDELLLAWLVRHDLSNHDVETIGVEDL